MAEAVKDYQKLEHDIIRLAGGADNIASAQRCATRLRLVLKNTPGQAEEKIKALALLPMELPKEIELDNTLEAMQKFVGGLIECITLSDTGSAVTLVCNDEGKLLGLPLNRPLWDGADVLAGPGFLAGCDNEGNLTSLPQSAMDFYKEKFRAFIIEI